MRNLPRLTISGDRQIPSRNLRRWLPVVALGLAVAAAYGFGLGDYLTLGSVARHRHWLKDYAAAHLAFGLLVYGLVYMAVVALSLPGAAALTIVGGFLFDWRLSAPLTAIAATAGAIVVFQAVKSSFGDSLAARAGPAYRRLAQGLEQDAFNFLLFLRLAPVFPFFIVNAVAGLSGMSLRTYAAATALGIIPATVAFSYLGAGLDSIIMAQEAAYTACLAEKGSANCTFDIAPSALVTSEIVVAFAALSVIALAPIAFRHLRPHG